MDVLFRIIDELISNSN